MAQSKSSFWRNTQTFLLVFSSADARLIARSRHDLEKVQKKTTYELTAIQTTTVKSLKQLRKALIKDTNQLRINNQPELSLKIIKIAENLGITSPQLEAQRAESLTALNEHEKAIQIWKSQATCDHLKVKDQANNALRLYEQDLNLASQLLRTLRTALETETIEPKHLPETTPYNLEILEYSIINEAIELRNENKNELSLKILDISTRAGLNSDLINDNKARVLFNMGNKREAIHIWQSLLSSKNPEVKHSAQKILSRLSKNLLVSVKKMITNNYLPIHYLPDEMPEDLSKLGVCILKEAIELRKAKQEDLSLQILDITTSAGFETDSINENRARALINVKRNIDAVNLLKELQSSKKKEIQESSTRILQTLGKGLITASNKMLTINDWEVRHLTEYQQQPIQKLEKLVLKEAIELRKNKKNELSLKILDLTIKAGLQTERIDDNRARALVNMKNYSDAVTIWQSLAESKNTKIKETATLMLERFGEKGMQQHILNEVDNALHSNNDGQRAINILTNAILQNPTDQKLHDRLGQVAMITEKKNDKDVQAFQELSKHRQSLAGFEAFITAIEQLHKPALPSNDETKSTTTIMRLN